MAWTLTGRSTDLAYTRIANDFGMDALEELFPIFPKEYDPIIYYNLYLLEKEVTKRFALSLA